MKKLVIIIIVLGLLVGGGYFGYNFYSNYFLAENNETPEPEVAEEDVAEDEVVVEEEEETETEEDDEEEGLAEDIFVEEDTEDDEEEEDPFEEEESEDEPEVVEVEQGKRAVPKAPVLTSYDGAFVKFFYPENYSTTAEHLNGVTFLDEDGYTTTIVDVYTNPDNESLEDYFSSRENLQNYFAEAEEFGKTPINIAQGILLFEDAIGIDDSDVYLVLLDGYIVKLAVFVGDGQAPVEWGRYVVPSVELSN